LAGWQTTLKHDSTESTTISGANWKVVIFLDWWHGTGAFSVPTVGSAKKKENRGGTYFFWHLEVVTFFNTDQGCDFSFWESTSDIIFYVCQEVCIFKPASLEQCFFPPKHLRWCEKTWTCALINYAPLLQPYRSLVLAEVSARHRVHVEVSPSKELRPRRCHFHWSDYRFHWWPEYRPGVKKKKKSSERHMD
jgi:hypothetical protein